MKKIFVTIFLFLTLIITSNTKDSLFLEANKLHTEGDYEAASVIYQDLIENGIISHSLFYNCGLSQYKLGNVGDAYYYFSKAYKLNPLGEKVNHYIHVIRSEYSIEDHDFEIIYKIFFFISPFFISILLVITLILIIISISVSITKRNKKLKNLLIALISFFMLISIFSTLQYIFSAQKICVVTEENGVELLLTPELPTVIDTLPMISTYRVIKQRNGYYYLRVNSKVSGWVNSNNVKLINN